MSEPFFTGVAMFDDEPKIPPPEAKPYIEARIGSNNYRGQSIRCLWDGNSRNEEAQAVLEEMHRRCHAAETDRDAYRKLLTEAAEALGELGPHSPLELFRRAREVHARITAELEAAK